MEMITMEEFESLIEENGPRALNIIDFRDETAFNERHIEGALNIPLDQLASHLSALEQNKVYYLVGYSELFAETNAIHLRESGFNTINVQSGMDEYSGPTV